MKQGWEVKKIKDIATLITDGDWIESRHQSEEGIRLIQTGNIGEGYFKAKDDKPHYITHQTFKVLGCTEIFPGDCIVSRLPDPVGRACIIPEIYCRMITAVDCTIIRFEQKVIPQFFIYYSLNIGKYKHFSLFQLIIAQTGKSAPKEMRGLKRFPMSSRLQADAAALAR